MVEDEKKPEILIKIQEDFMRSQSHARKISTAVKNSRNNKDVRVLSRNLLSSTMNRRRGTTAAYKNNVPSNLAMYNRIV